MDVAYAEFSVGGYACTTFIECHYCTLCCFPTDTYFKLLI